MPSEQKKIFQYDLADVANEFLLHLKQSIECVTHIYNALEIADVDLRKPLPTDSLPFIVQDDRIKITLDQQKQISISWILSKVFEEYVNGLMKTFKVTYRYLKLYSLSNEAGFNGSVEVLNKELQRLEKDIEKFHFPDFINQIEILLGNPLYLREEIISINKVRNCLVHRNGIVGRKDITNTNSLDLKWNSLVNYSKMDGKDIELSYNHRKDKIILDNFSIQRKQNIKSYALNDEIKFNINEINGLSYTCSEFVLKLMNQVPRP